MKNVKHMLETGKRNEEYRNGQTALHLGKILSLFLFFKIFSSIFL